MVALDDQPARGDLIVGRFLAIDLQRDHHPVALESLRVVPGSCGGDEQADRQGRECEPDPPHSETSVETLDESEGVPVLHRITEVLPEPQGKPGAVGRFAEMEKDKSRGIDCRFGPGFGRAPRPSDRPSRSAAGPTPQPARESDGESAPKSEPGEG